MVNLFPVAKLPELSLTYTHKLQLELIQQTLTLILLVLDKILVCEYNI